MTPEPPRRRDRPSRRITDEQQHTIHAIACLTLLHGRAPELGEIAGVLGVSKGAASYRLMWLEKKGLVDKRGLVRGRGCELTELGLRSALRPPVRPGHRGRAAWRALARTAARAA